MSDTPKRGWLRFSIRDLFWITVVIALALAWYVDHAKAARDHAASQKALSEITSCWNNLVALLKGQGVTVEPYADMISWKGKTFPVNFKAAVDSAPGDAALLSPALPASQAPAPNPPKP